VVVYTGTAADLTPYLFMEADYPAAMAVPEPTGARTFFFEVRRAFGAGPFTEQVRFDLEGGPVAAAPADSIFVNDDAANYPAVVLSSATGETLQTFPFPSGETADRLPSGVSLWQDFTNNQFVVYSGQFTVIASVAWPVGAPVRQRPIGASPTRFFVGDPGTVSPAVNATVTTVSAAGVLGPTVWDLGAPSVFALAPSPDETILYYRKTTSGADSAVQRWDLVNDVALADLVATVPGFSVPADLVVLTDGTILVPYRALAGSTVKRYSAAGALLNTYTMTGPLNRMARSSDNLTTFWVWLFPDSDYSTFEQIRVSDGVVLSSATAPQSDDGILRPPSTAPRQGPSNSCPFLTTPEPLPAITFGDPEPPPEPSYHLDARYIRRLRRAPHVNNENLRVFYRRFELDLERGQALASGQGSEPYVLLRISRDGGQTWGQESRMAAGALGEYTARVDMRRLGYGRDLVFEIVVSDPIAWSIVGAWLDLEPGAH
jgi:hypothetical protein